MTLRPLPLVTVHVFLHTKRILTCMHAGEALGTAPMAGGWLSALRAAGYLACHSSVRVPD